MKDFEFPRGAEREVLLEALRKYHNAAVHHHPEPLMSIPPDKSRDADLLLHGAIDELADLRADLSRLREAARLALAAVARLGRPRQFPEPCWCETIDRVYCVGQPRCKETNAALAALRSCGVGEP